MATAVVAYCRQEGIEPSAEVKDFNILQGEGICGLIAGHNVYIGNSRLKSRLCWGQGKIGACNINCSSYYNFQTGNILAMVDYRCTRHMENGRLHSGICRSRYKICRSI